MKQHQTIFTIISITIIIIIVILLCFYFLFFLRKPERIIPNNENIFVSPANGKIINIIHSKDKNIIINKNNRHAFNEYISDVWTGEKTIVSIMMTPMNVHRQRAPNNAKLISQNYKKWLFLNAMKNAEKWNATYQNEHNSMLFETTDSIRFKVIQIAWVVARRIISKIKVWDKLKQWDIIWLIKLWSQVTMIFDNNIDILVKIGDVVIDGESIIAKKK